MKEHKPGEKLEAYKKAHEHKSAKKNWIAGAIKKPGALKESLGVKSGNKIPSKTLHAASEKGGKMGQRARLAETLKGFKHKATEMEHMHKHAMKSMAHVAKHAMHAIDGMHKEHAKHVAHMAKGHAHKAEGAEMDTVTPNLNKKHAHKSIIGYSDGHMGKKKSHKSHEHKKHEKKEAHKKHEKEHEKE